MTFISRIPVTWRKVLVGIGALTVPVVYYYTHSVSIDNVSHRRDTVALQQFFASSTPPNDIHLVQNRLETYLKNLPEGCPVAIVTSGGTMVPLEKRTVRFIDNFSTGARGSALTERLLKNNYAVVFLYRQGSRRPFVNTIIDDIDTTVKTIVSAFSSPSPVSSSSSPSRAPFPPPPSVKKPFSFFGWTVTPEMQYAMDIIDKFSKSFETLLKAYSRQQYIEIPYTSVNDYLYKLKLTSTMVHDSRKEKSLILLAAAVSDFYIPENKLTEHKIQSDGAKSYTANIFSWLTNSSNNRGLTIELYPVPKALYTLKKDWAPHSCVISFKLETDPALLLSKAWGSIQVSEMDAVVANILEKRYSEITIVRNPVILQKFQIPSTTITVSDGSGSSNTNSTDSIPTIPSEPKEQIRVSPTGCILTDRWQRLPSTSSPSTSSILPKFDKLFSSTPSSLLSIPNLIPTTDIQIPVSPANSAVSLASNQPLEDALVQEIMDIHHVYQYGIPMNHTPSEKKINVLVNK